MLPLPSLCLLGRSVQHGPTCRWLGQQFEPDLPNISLADVSPLTLMALLSSRRDQLQDVLQVTSTQRLVVAIPGFSLKDLPETAVTHARKCNTTIVVHDPSLMCKELKNVTLFSLCEQDVEPKAHVASDDFVPAPTVELAVLIQRPNLEAVGIDWSAFTARLRSEVRQVVLAQLDSSHHPRVELYAWKKLTDDVHRVIVRIPAPALNTFLQHSGIDCPLTFQTVWEV